MMLKFFGTALPTLALAVTLAGQDVAREQKLQQAIDLLETKGDIAGAVPLLEEVAKSADATLAVRGLLYLGRAQERQGQDQARKTYERIIRDFPNQRTEVQQARLRLQALAGSTAGIARGGAPAGRRRLEPPDVIGQEWGRVSPDGRWLSYVDPRSGNLGLWQVGTDTTKLLTTVPCCDYADGYAEASIWSPDGRFLAFAWRRQEIGLKVISRDGGEPRVVFAGASRGIRDLREGDVTWILPYDWSPDGKHVLAGFGAFVSAGVVGRSRLVLVDVQDGTVRTLKELGRSAPNNARFSPDGRHVIFDHPPSEQDRRDVFIMAADGSGHRPLVEDPVSHDTALTWLDDNTVLYVSDRMGTPETWRVSVRDGKAVAPAVRVAAAVGEHRALGRAADGALLTAVYLQLSDVLSAPIDPGTGRAARQPDPIPRPPTTAVRSHGTFSPGGSRLAYFQKKGASSATLIVQELATGATRLYPLGIQNPERPVWRPDEGAIAFNAAATDDQGGERLFLLDLGSGQISELGEGVQAAFSPDGKFLYFPQKGSIVRRELVNGTEAVIHRGPGVARALLMSPDGRWLATFLSGAIVLVPSDGGAPREILKAPPDKGRLMNPLAWSRDGSHLFITALRPGNEWRETVWRAAIDDGSIVDTGVYVSKGKINRLSHGSDGQLAISVGRGDFEIWSEPMASLLGGVRR